MTKLNLLAAMGSAIMLALIAGTSAAAPLSQAADATIKAAGTLTIVEQAHGVHRSCQLGLVRRWGATVRWHRHVGPAHMPVRC
jgi:hypothetical protein